MDIRVYLAALTLVLGVMVGAMALALQPLVHSRFQAIEQIK